MLPYLFFGSAAVKETSVREHRVRSQSSLPPLFSAPKPRLILTMMKKP